MQTERPKVHSAQKISLLTSITKNKKLSKMSTLPDFEVDLDEYLCNYKVVEGNMLRHKVWNRQVTQQVTLCNTHYKFYL